MAALSGLERPHVHEVCLHPDVAYIDYVALCVDTATPREMFAAIPRVMSIAKRAFDRHGLQVNMLPGKTEGMPVGCIQTALGELWPEGPVRRVLFTAWLSAVLCPPWLYAGLGWASRQ